MSKHILLLVSILAIILAVESEAYYETTPFPGLLPEKLTNLHFYFHNILSGDNPTAIRVTNPPAVTNSTTTASFGVVVVADNLLTEGPDPSSKEVGRAQGMYASSDMNTLSFTMVFNLAFTEGEFNGSTLSLYGRNAILSTDVVELPVIGGTGAFRFARGYAQVKTHKRENFTAVVDYNVFVWH